MPESDGSHGLGEAAEAQIERLLDHLAADETAATTVRDPEAARAVHIADSLSALELAPVREATMICDIGTGAGFPALPLAAALPSAEVHALDSITRKCEYVARAAAAAGLANVRVVDARAETYAAGEGRERFDLVTSRAVGRLSTLAELASPLLRDGGHLVAWKGRRDPDEEAELERAAADLAMSPVEIRWVGPYAGSENRHLHLLVKRGATPERLPRRDGMAKKRPLGSR